MNEPKEVEQEMEVLGGMINDDACFFEALSELDHTYFTDVDSRSIFNMIVKKGSRSTAAMLERETSERRLRAAIRTFEGKYINNKEFRHSMTLLKDTYYKRQLYYTINKTVNRFNEASYEDLVAIIQNDINSFAFQDTGDNIMYAEDRAGKFYDDFIDDLNNPEFERGIPYSVEDGAGNSSGFPNLNETLGGAGAGDLIMIAGRTGEGKTAFALNLARLFSFRQNFWGYYLNTEMAVDELESRLLAPIAGVEANEILYRQLKGTWEEQQQKVKDIKAASVQYETKPFVISRIPDLPLHKAQGLAKQVKHQIRAKMGTKEGELDYLIVDYIGMMHIEGSNQKTWDELAKMTTELKKLAEELEIPIFMLAQRNQSGDVEGAKKMANACDGVLYFEPLYDEDMEDIRNNVIAKNSHLVNYKIIKNKIRRNDDYSPIYVQFNKKQNSINEIR